MFPTDGLITTVMIYILHWHIKKSTKYAATLQIAGCLVSGASWWMLQCAAAPNSLCITISVRHPRGPSSMSWYPKSKFGLSKWTSFAVWILWAQPSTAIYRTCLFYITWKWLYDLIIHLLWKYLCFGSFCLFKMYFPILPCTIPCKLIVITSARVIYPGTTIVMYSYRSINDLHPCLTLYHRGRNL